MTLLFNPFDKLMIQQAIAAAEKQTSGEIRVVIYPDEVSDAVAKAQMEFVRLGMHRTRERNAVLLLVAPKSHTYAILGDEAIHAKCGPDFWNEIAQTMAADFKRGAFNEGVVRAIRRAGEMLAKHFPPSPDDKNELPDDVIERGIVI
ncbi:MAG TPA: TPM domain-containing protein [Opitutaceae bacterium]|nr:TPM domain-containing protein [Opitutaceae bacterium]